MCGDRGATKGGGKKICATPLDRVSAGKQGLVWGRQRGNNVFPEFSQRKWHFLEGERELFSSPTTAPSVPFPSPPRPPRGSPACLWHPRSRLPGRYQPLNFLLLSSFMSRQSQGEPEELLGPRWGSGAYTCL